MDSILTSVKKLLGIAEENTDFDPDVIMAINSAFMVLTQLGVGSEDGFTISDSSAVWSDFLEDTTQVEAVKEYVGLKVRLMFDPPTSSTVMQATTNMTSELEWRLNILCDTTTGVLSGSTSDTDCEKRVDDVLKVILDGKY